MQTHHTAATCCLRLGAATIMLPARWIVNVGTRLTGWNSVGRLTRYVYALPHETHSGADARAKISDFECFPAQNPYVLRKNHTPAAPLRQLQSPLAPAACQMRVREIRRGITRRNSFHALDYIARRRRRDLTPRAGDNRVWITFDCRVLTRTRRGGPPQWSKSQR
jgi:hypothetical protein